VGKNAKSGQEGSEMFEKWAKSGLKIVVGHVFFVLKIAIFDHF